MDEYAEMVKYYSRIPDFPTTLLRRIAF